MGKPTDYSKLSQEDLAALCAEKDSAIAEQAETIKASEELVKELISKNEQLSISEKKGVPTLTVGKKTYTLVTPQFYHEGKLVNIEVLRKDLELAKKLIEDNSGNLEEIGEGSK